MEELLLSVGESVSEDDVVAVVETDKVSLDVKANVSGVVRAQTVGPLRQQRLLLRALNFGPRVVRVRSIGARRVRRGG